MNLRGEYGRERVGASTEEDVQALAILRTVRGKLARGVEVASMLFLTIDSRPPGGGAIGGDDLVITPTNLGLVNWALSVGGDRPIATELLPPSEWRSETETGRSRESVAQLFLRVSRAIERILDRARARA